MIITVATGGQPHTSSTTPLPPPPVPGPAQAERPDGGWGGSNHEAAGQDGVPRQQRAFLSLALPSTFSGLESGELGSLLTWQLAPRGPRASPTLLGPHCPSPPGREVEPQGADWPGLSCQRTLRLRLHRLGTSGDRICMQVMCRCALVCMRRQVCRPACAHSCPCAQVMCPPGQLQD